MIDDAEIREAIASLNDVVAELCAGLASGDTPSKGYAYTVITTLGEHTKALGHQPQLGADDVADWEGAQ